jgi:hypothetical protein
LSKKGKSRRPLKGGGDRVEKCEKNGMSGHRWRKEIKRDGVRKQCPKEPVSIPDWMGGKIKTLLLPPTYPCLAGEFDRVKYNFMFTHHNHHHQHRVICFPQNLVGTFRCACPEGFIQHFYRSECVDDNECNQSPCGSGACYNTFGSYRCGCPDGYQFDTALSVCIQVELFIWSDRECKYTETQHGLE